ncbi:hypothetical protein FHX81_1416 [Saccharothrix saharensis]|uniref:MarR family protein n=1 Tax=Saccharothrix saharensis TaxID=571190 RepID=A0A543J8G9_9PSEU|nr:hypothetical protein [Saccharothrix saharensis]TQM79121.1 hypothetical protein FHX81_1416 [Saccharothrix saharensis]
MQAQTEGRRGAKRALPLRALRVRGPLSRAQPAVRSGLSKVAVAPLPADLENRGLVERTGTTTSRSRPGRLVEPRPGAVRPRRRADRATADRPRRRDGAVVAGLPLCRLDLDNEVDLAARAERGSDPVDHLVHLNGDRTVPDPLGGTSRACGRRGCRETRVGPGADAPHRTADAPASGLSVLLTPRKIVLGGYSAALRDWLAAPRRHGRTAIAASTPGSTAGGGGAAPAALRRVLDDPAVVPVKASAPKTGGSHEGASA